MTKKRLTVFISYSWDGEEHKNWVLKLANYLIEKAGVNVLLDQYELQAGRELTHFMESGIEKADKVLIILTEKYKQKADDRQGGTGFEYSLISQGLYELQSRNDKFIPILRQGKLKTSAPAYVKTKIYHQMTDDSNFEIDAFQLSRILYDKPELVKPELGDIPDFDNPDFDSLVAMANNISSQENLNKALDALLGSEEGVLLARKEFDILFTKVIEKADEYTDKTEFKFTTEKDYKNNQLIVSSSGHSVYIAWSGAYSNSTKGTRLVLNFWKGHKRIDNLTTYYFPGEEPKLVEKKEFSIDLKSDKKIVWRKNEIEIVESNEIIKEIFTYSPRIRVTDHREERRIGVGTTSVRIEDHLISGL